jgi:hypothetical protein
VCVRVCVGAIGTERVKRLPHGVSRARGPHGPGQQHHLHHQPPWRHHRLVAGQQPGSGKPPGKAPLPAGKLPLPTGKQHRFPLANRQLYFYKEGRMRESIKGLVKKALYWQFENYLAERGGEGGRQTV